VDNDVERFLYRYEPISEGHLRWEPIRELPVGEWKEISDALSLLNAAISGPPLYSAFAQRDIDIYVMQLEERLAKRDQIRRSEEWLPEFRYRFIAASSAIRMHEETVLAFANRRRTASAATALKAVFSKHYDSSLSYRVMYALRNLLVHGSDGVLETRATATLGADDNTSARVELRLNRAIFASTSVNAAVRHQVAALSEDPDLLKMAAEASSVVQRMRRDLDPILYPGQASAAELIFRYVEEAHTAGGGGPHFHMHATGDPFVLRSILPMTEKVFRFVLDAKRGDPARGEHVSES
jgi:hypothetical protein